MNSSAQLHGIDTTLLRSSFPEAGTVPHVLFLLLLSSTQLYRGDWHKQHFYCYLELLITEITQ